MGCIWGKEAIRRPSFSLLEYLPVVVDTKIGSIYRGYSVCPQTCLNVALRGIEADGKESCGKGRVSVFYVAWTTPSSDGNF